MTVSHGARCVDRRDFWPHGSRTAASAIKSYRTSVSRKVAVLRGARSRDGATRSEAGVGAAPGPVGPEVGCDECFDHLDRSVELELAGQDADAAIPACARTSRAAPPAATSTRAFAALVGGEQQL